MNPSPPRHTLTIALWLGYLTFVIYGSLVPFDFRSLPLAQAWQIFQHTPMYRLGIESRADWIANGVLYVPLGFLTAHLLIHGLGNKSLGAILPRLFLAGVFSVTLALGVEFSQIFFPPRTVSLNDLLAECIGSLLGLLLAAKYSDWFKSLLYAIFDAPERLVLHALEAYIAGYIAFSLFPFDVLLSSAEIGQKIQGNDWGWLLANAAHGKVLTLLKLLPEAFLTLPFGLYLGFLGYRAHRRPVNLALAALLGALLGGFVETAQFFTASGVSQGLSVASRALGVCGGLVLWRRRGDWSPEKASAFVRQHSALLGAAYLLLLWLVNGGLSSPVLGVDEAVARFTSLHFMPFYYHYYTTEARALLRLASVCFMYLPIGLLVWARRGTPAGAFWLALALAFTVETGKLFLQGAHPDPTNIMLGALASWGALQMAGLLEETTLTATSVTSGHTIAFEEAPPPALSTAPEKPAKTPNDFNRNKTGVTVAIALTLLATVFWQAATFPVLAAPLCLLLAVIAAIVWRRSELSLLIVPLALPVLDLAPWSGRFYLDEFDLLVAVCLIVAYLRLPPCARRTAPTRADPVFRLALVLLTASLAISALRGLLPWQALDANAFTNYFSAFNALRIGKGALWALLFYGLLRRLETSQHETGRLLATGLIGGLALTIVFVAWERMAFASLLDFSNAYRITGPFSSMHVGGAYIECFLAVAAPFLLLRILQTHSLLNKALGILLLIGTTYALMVTYSRNGYAAYMLGLMTCLVFAGAHLIFHAGQQHRARHVLFVAALGGIMLAVAIPVFTGKFAQQRMATVGKDFVTRQAHWEDAHDIRQKSWPTLLFGTGLGRYPAEHYLFSAEKGRAGTYQLRTENGNTFLTLTSGDPVYVEQMVDIEPRRTYVLKLDIRSAAPQSRVDLSLCEKWMLASANCEWKTLTLGAAETWTPIQLQLSSTPFTDKPWYAERPIRFTVHSPTRKTRRIDVDNIRLETLHGKNLLANGDFSREFDHWFFTVDNHLQWHAKSLPVAVWFDQGMFGVLALGLFVLIACQRATRLAWRGNPHATAALASFVAFLTVGLFDTLIDTPRFLFLFLLLGMFCARFSRNAGNAKIKEHNP